MQFTNEDAKMTSDAWLGLDLGGEVRGRSALAVLGGRTDKPHLEAITLLGGQDDSLWEVVSSLRTRDPTVAIDAPLSLPICLQAGEKCTAASDCAVGICRSVRNHPGLGRKGLPYAERASEFELRTGIWREFGISPKLTMQLGIIAGRGIYLKRSLVSRGFPESNVLEVYPGASWKVREGKEIGVVIKRARKGDSKALGRLASSLQRYADAEASRLTEFGLDGLDSVMCALTAYWHTKGQTVSLGGQDGRIVVPTPEPRSPGESHGGRRA